MRATDTTNRAAVEHSTAAVAAPVPVTVCVHGLMLGLGEQLRLVGSCQELGRWESAAAPLLEWQPSDSWVVTLALPPGRHTYKLVRVQEGGGMQWEDGEDRVLGVPAAAVALTASLRFGDTAAVEMVAEEAGGVVAGATGLAPGQPPAAAATASRVAALQHRTRQLSSQIDALEAEVEERWAAGSQVLFV